MPAALEVPWARACVFSKIEAFCEEFALPRQAFYFFFLLEEQKFLHQLLPVILQEKRSFRSSCSKSVHAREKKLLAPAKELCAC